ncbi:arabinosyltransferase domain-containing protein [Lentzea sp. NBRC 102530]|uniref:arabinosyltransferase domain-containing protein n=1 Tax=Lentzea sp. NBRC 102530 TaxID=3032201 RepID=UPI002553A5F4|nr:arabinosyltransferase domain-containing protein [Lentzea sp. NBRC 102530]
MRRTRRLKVAALVSGALTVLFAALMPLAPVTINDPVVTWPESASTAPRSTMLPLSAYRPFEVDARFGCDTVRAAQASGGVVFATITPTAPARGLVVQAENGRLLISGVATLDEPVPAGSCAYEIRGDRDGLSILRDGREIGRAPMPDVHVLATTITVPGTDLSVRIRVDDQFSTSPSVWKTVLVVLLALSTVTAFACLVLMDRRVTREPSRFRWRLSLVDLVVPAIMLAWLFLAPMSDDDGYYSAMARNVPFEGYVGNYYQILNQGFTPFSWFYYFLAKWQVFGFAPVVLRIPALLFGLVTWFAARRYVSGKFSGVVLGAAFLAWWLPLDMGVRPEGVVTMCGLLTLLAVTAAVERQRLAWLGAAVGVAGIGFFAHPTGFTTLAPLIAGLPFIWKLLAEDAGWRTIVARVLAVLSPGAIAVIMAFSDGSLRDFLYAQEIFKKMAGSETWYTEFARWVFLLNQGDAMANYAKRAPVLLCVVALIWFVVLVTAARARRIEVPSRLALAGWSTLFAFFLLWFTPSKWTHHFGSLAGIGSVFLALMLLAFVPLVRELTTDRKLSVPVLFGGVVSVVVMMGLAGHGANLWPYSWHLGLPSAGVPPHVSVLKFDKPYWWLLLIVVVAVVLYRRGKGSLAPVIAIPVVVVLFFAANVTYLVGGFAVATARTLDTWSPWAANVQDPLAEKCVAADGIEVATPQALVPLPDRWFAIQTGPIATVVTGKPASITYEYATSNAEVLSGGKITDTVDSTLRRTLVLPPAPSGATQVRLTGDGEFSAPAAQKYVPLREFLPREAAVGVAWQFAFLFPCQRQPRVQDGVIEPISYAVQWGDSPWLGLSDATWQPVRGALFGDVLTTHEVTALPARLRDFAGPHPIQVYRTTPLYETGGYTTTHDRQTRMGWEGPR